MKYSQGRDSEFYSSLSAKIDDYFIENSVQKTGGAGIMLKALTLTFLFFVIYFSILFLAQTTGGLLTAYAMLGLVSVLLFFNIVHDASHNTFSTNKRLNRLLCYVGELVGINSYIWHIRHDMQHHSFTNVLNGDIINHNIPIIRITPHQQLRKVHKYQHFYAPLLYALYSLYWIIALDFILFRKGEASNKRIEPSKFEWSKLIFFKTAYFCYTVLIPLFVTSFKWPQVLLGFFVMHVFAGLLVSLVSVLGHDVEGTDFPAADKDNLIHNSWGEHQIETTADFGNRSYLLTALLGGLNTHVCHHLFPRISHIHYFHLTPIIRKHCEEFDFTLNEYSVLHSITSHFRYLKELGSTTN